MLFDYFKKQISRFAYACYARFARTLQSRGFLFSIGAIVGVPNIGKKLDPRGDDFAHSNILVIRSDALGDNILAIPFLRSLKKQLPYARVTLAVSNPWRGLFEALKIVDEVIGFPFDSDKWTAASRVWKAFIFGSSVLKRRKFDLVINPRWDADFHDAFLLVFFSFAPHRIAFFEKATPWKSVSNHGRDHFYTHVVSDIGTRHEAERSLQLLNVFGLNAISESQIMELMSIADCFPPAKLDLPLPWEGCEFIGVFPGVQDGKRQWPVDKFVDCAKLLLKRKNVRFLVFGSVKEAAHCAYFCQELPEFSHNYSAKTDLPTLAGILRRCSVVISCNSGGAHLASALDVPVTVLFSIPFGLDADSVLSPERFRPLSRKVMVLQPQPSLKSDDLGNKPSSASLISPEQVAETVISLIEEQ